MFVALIVGFVTGVCVSTMIFKNKAVGTLRVDNSDPDSGSFLFLELYQGGLDDICKKDYVRFKVERKNIFRRNNTFYYGEIR